LIKRGKHIPIINNVDNQIKIHKYINKDEKHILRFPERFRKYQHIHKDNNNNSFLYYLLILLFRRQYGFQN
jgi:hypothetical protein